MASETNIKSNRPRRRRGSLSRHSLSTLAVCLMTTLGVAGTALAAEGPAHSGGHPESATASTEAEKVNTYCPVMPGMLADPNIYIDYQGKRIYLCCPNCKSAFFRDPDKYLHRLPQFGAVAASVGHDHDHDDSAGVSTYGLIRPVGIFTFSLLTLTVTAGLLRRKRPKLLLKWHKRLGIATLVAAVLHLLVILMAY